MNDKSKSQVDALLAKVRSGITRNVSEPVVNQDLQAPDASKYPEYSLVQSIKALYNDGNSISNPYFLARSGEVSSNLQIAGNDYITFSNYNYLGLSHDPRVKAAVHEAVDQYGCHAGAARMVGGEIELHAQLEQELAAFTGFEAVSVGVGGYSANVSVIGYLLDKQDLIIHDEYMHNSAIMGSVMSGARRIAFAHNDMAALDRLLSENRPHYRRALILVEGAYSMDGDLVDLPGVVALKKKHGAWLMIDEAHSVGTVGKTGRGVCEHFAVDTAEVDLIIGTLSKSFASCGGFVAGKKQLIELLHHFCPGLLLYSTGISPANTAAALAAVRLANAEPERVERLQHNARRFKQMAEERGLDCRSSLAGVPIVPLMIKDERALHLMSKLLDNSIIAHAVMHPVVPREAARLRCFISHDHDETMFTRTLDLLVEDASSAL